MGGIAGNRYYNDPALGQGFANLAAALAPPSAQDLEAYATAKATREKAARLAEFYNLAHQPTLDQGVFDREGQSLGLWTPNTGYFGVNTAAATSRANNAADNERAIETQRMQDDAALKRQIMSPVRAGQNETVYMPTPAANAAGLPPVLRGNINVQPGERVYSGNTIYDGHDKPLSVDEWNAQQLERLRESGTVSDQQIADAAFGKETPVQAVGPDGNPVFMAPGTATRIGAQPYIKPDANAKQTNGLAVLKDGTRVPAIQAPEGYWTNAQTGARLPDDIQIFDMPRPQGSAQDVGLLKSTEASDKAGIFYSRAAPASNNLDAALAGGYVPQDLDYEFSLGALSGAPNAVANRAVSDAGRKFYNNAQNFMMAILRPDTGAAFGKEEFQSYARVFIPLPGDDPQTIKDKAIARQTALAALSGTSRGADVQIARLLAAQGLPVPKEMADVIARGGVRAGDAVSPAGGPAPAPASFPDGQSAAPAAVPAAAPPAVAVDALRKNPALAAEFDQKYGPGSAQRALSATAPPGGGGW